MFEIVSVSNGRNKDLDDSHNVLFRRRSAGEFSMSIGSAWSYLSCHGGDTCHLKKLTQCPIASSTDLESISNSCLENTFKVIKLSEF